MAVNGTEGEIDDLLTEVFERRALLANQVCSTEGSRLPSPRVFSSEHYRDVLGSILECGDSDACCLRPSEQRLSVYSKKKLIGRTGRTLYSSGEGRPCHEVIRPFTEGPSPRRGSDSRRDSDSSPSSPSSHQGHGQRDRHHHHNRRTHKDSAKVHSERLDQSIEGNRKKSDKSDRRHRRHSDQGSNYEDERSRGQGTSRARFKSHVVQGHAGDNHDRFKGPHGHKQAETISIMKRKSKSKGPRDPINGDHGQNVLDYINKIPGDKRKNHGDRGIPGENRIPRDKHGIPRDKRKNPGDNLISGEINKSLADKNKISEAIRSTKSGKLPVLLSKSQQLKLARDADAEEKRKKAERDFSKRRTLTKERLRLPKIAGLKEREVLERHLWDAEASGSDPEGESGDAKYNYDDCDDDAEPKPPDYSSWELATTLIKKPLKSLRGTIPPPQILQAYVRKRFPGEEWASGCPTGRRFYPDGTTFVASFANGAAHVFYPHGGLAIAISAPHPTHQVLVFRDPMEGFYFLDKSLLGGFNTLGIGVVYDNQGVTRLRYDLEGGYQLDGSGQAHRWRWNGAGQRLLQKLNPYLSLRTLDLNSIHLLFNGNKRGVRLNIGRGHVINLVAPNPLRFTRRPWWDAYQPSPGNSMGTVKGQRPPVTAGSDSWECCQVPCCYPCPTVCSPCDYDCCY